MTSNNYKNKRLAENYGAFLRKRRELCNLDENYIKRNILKNSTVLDLGCGTGRHIARLGKRYSFTGIDISSHMIHLANMQIQKKGVIARLIVGDICNIDKLVKNNFNAVIMMYHTLGCITPRSKRLLLLKKINSLLKENGDLILHVHNRNHIRNLSFLSKNLFQSITDNSIDYGDKLITDGVLGGCNIHFFSRFEIKRLLKQAGFDIIDFLDLRYPKENVVLHWPTKLLFSGGFIIKARKCINK